LSLQTLAQARKIAPKNGIVLYETAYAHCMKKNYKEALKIIKKVIRKKRLTNDFAFQLFGNCHSFLGRPQKAVQIYKKGLVKNPNAGRLYLELGNIELHQKNYEKALPIYEEGIWTQPTFASNYFWASKIYCNSTEPLWGLIYGEIFLNLEPNTERTKEISALLYNTFQNSISFQSDTSISVSLSQYDQTRILSKTDGSQIVLLPYGKQFFEPQFALALAGSKQLDVESLHKARLRFLQQLKWPSHRPIILFDYHKQLVDAGHFEAYNYWLFSQGDYVAWDLWVGKNPARWDAFAEWFEKNPLILNHENKFHTSGYAFFNE